MNRLSCLITLLAIGFGVVGSGAYAEETKLPAAQNQAELERDLAEFQALLEAAQPKWTASASVFLAAGVNDNLLLSPDPKASPQDPERSSFVRGGVEALLWRVPKGKIDYFGFLNAERTRYFSGDSVDHDAQAFAGLEWRYREPDRLSLLVDLQGYYLDEVFDISDTYVRRQVAELQLTGAKFGPTLRWWVRPWFWVEGTATGSRQTFDDGVNNATLRDSAAAAAWVPTDRVELRLTKAERRRDYDQRTLFDSDGAPDPQGRLIVIHERSWEGQLQLTLGHSRHWKTTSAAGELRYRDNGSGFLDYFQQRVRQEVEWSAGNWLARVSGDASRKDYRLQTVGEGFPQFLPHLFKEELGATVRVERALTKHWTLFAEYRWGRTRSNDEYAVYEMNEGLLGARWNWEK
ncbi:hypothetical protein [Opitutus sp. ER46]|uniref:hypothetical protein n=1 Tax=Opitutus sp. ER46 TaxID=2161864 RepID=UPI000D3259DB|nr:hypothetical protein [Opitutus sp. ER46]PTX99031.1 hypothetical protein DB354_03165 [Opitutus sp. ER46]